MAGFASFFSPVFPKKKRQILRQDLQLKLSGQRSKSTRFDSTCNVRYLLKDHREVIRESRVRHVPNVRLQCGGLPCDRYLYNIHIPPSSLLMADIQQRGLRLDTSSPPVIPRRSPLRPPASRDSTTSDNSPSLSSASASKTSLDSDPPLSSTMSKRQHALLELLESERAYASDLALVREVHIPLALGACSFYIHLRTKS